MALGEGRTALDRKKGTAVRVTLAGDGSAETVRWELCQKQSWRERDPKAGKGLGRQEGSREQGGRQDRIQVLRPPRILGWNQDGWVEYSGMQQPGGLLPPPSLPVSCPGPQPPTRAPCATASLLLHHIHCQGMEPCSPTPHPCQHCPCSLERDEPAARSQLHTFQAPASRC